MWSSQFPGIFADQLFCLFLEKSKEIMWAQEVDFLTATEGRMVCSKSFNFPMVGGRNWVACFWTSESVDKGCYLEAERQLSRTMCAWRWVKPGLLSLVVEN